MVKKKGTRKPRAAKKEGPYGGMTRWGYGARIVVYTTNKTLRAQLMDKLTSIKYGDLSPKAREGHATNEIVLE